MDTHARTLRKYFTCRACGVVHPFHRVQGGVQQQTCPDDPVLRPDGTPARGPYLQATDRADVWLVWERSADGKLDISCLEMPGAVIPMADDATKQEH